MKIFYLDCTKEELQANRSVMDIILDAFRGVADTIVGGGYRKTACRAEEYQETEEEEGDDE